MTDPALLALLDPLRHGTGPQLLVADEAVDPAFLAAVRGIPALTLLTNRYDIHQHALALGLTSHFNDMDLAALPGPFQRIAYRISKEKALVHHLINQAPAHLLPGGQLLLSGYRDEGFRTYVDKAEVYFGASAQRERGERQCGLATLTPAVPGTALDDRGYREWKAIAHLDGLRLFSKPGQYGWDKQDAGSRLLVACLHDQWQAGALRPSSVLDLGCGYGYLSLAAAQAGIPWITATDNNAAALLSCQRNFTENRIAGEVIADDCAHHIDRTFDTVLCNPPFHRGFDTEKNLTENFVHSAHAHLTRTGWALFVVNRFIPLETVAATRFRQVELLRQDARFKVLKLYR